MQGRYFRAGESVQNISDGVAYLVMWKSSSAERCLHWSQHGPRVGHTNIRDSKTRQPAEENSADQVQQ